MDLTVEHLKIHDSNPGNSNWEEEQILVISEKTISRKNHFLCQNIILNYFLKKA